MSDITCPRCAFARDVLLCDDDSIDLGDQCTCGTGSTGGARCEPILNSCTTMRRSNLLGHNLVVDTLVFDEPPTHDLALDACRICSSSDYEDEIAREMTAVRNIGTPHADPAKTAVPIWCQNTGASSPGAGLECARLLMKTFQTMWTLESEASLHDCNDVLSEIRERYNVEIVEVERVNNLQRLHMWKCFADCYQIQKHRTVYHGTTQQSARSIIASGFRGAACQRSKYGRGIYTSTGVWEALCYASPEGSVHTQTLIIADLLQGPSALGHKDQVDFGTSEEGRQILTLTNPEATILCASHENQLLPTYRVTVRFMAERAITPLQYMRVRMFHPLIWEAIRACGKTSEPRHVPSLSTMASACSILPTTTDANANNPPTIPLTTDGSRPDCARNDSLSSAKASASGAGADVAASDAEVVEGFEKTSRRDRKRPRRCKARAQV